eukprot:scaffold229630_cov21-Tisochrysis_lutea.AAC.1
MPPVLPTLLPLATRSTTAACAFRLYRKRLQNVPSGAVLPTCYVTSIVELIVKAIRERPIEGAFRSSSANMQGHTSMIDLIKAV